MDWRSFVRGRRLALFAELTDLHITGGEKGSTADDPLNAEQPDAGSIPAASTTAHEDLITLDGMLATIRPPAVGSPVSKTGAGGSTPPERATLGSSSGRTAGSEPADEGSTPSPSAIPSVWSPELNAVLTSVLGFDYDAESHRDYCYECGRPLDDA